MWNLNFEQWNLYVEPGGTWTFNSGTFMWNLNFEQWNLYVEPGGTSTLNSGTFITLRLGRSERGVSLSALTHGWTDLENEGGDPSTP